MSAPTAARAAAAPVPSDGPSRRPGRGHWSFKADDVPCPAGHAGEGTFWRPTRTAGSQGRKCRICRRRGMSRGREIRALERLARRSNR